jgi:hypothetical protein
MARPLPVQLNSCVRELRDATSSFELATDVGVITVRGHLSVGSKGWRLRAEAARQRSVVTINITATETATERLPDLECHEYTATVRLGIAGRYCVRIAHAFVLRGLGGQGMPRPVFEETASVP